jgi:hypothetical protein
MSYDRFMFNRAQRPQHRFMAWMAIFAILLQTLIPALHHPASMAMMDMPGMDGANGLCVAPGSTSPAPGAPNKAPAHQIPPCALCQAVHAIGGFAPPPAPVVIATTTVPTVFIAVLTEFTPAQPAHSSQQPRAPPSFA